MEKKEKQKPINLTDALVKSLPTKDSDYWVSDITPGLKLRVWPRGEKVWYFRYRPKGKGPQRIQLDSFRLLSDKSLFSSNIFLIFFLTSE